MASFDLIPLVDSRIDLPKIYQKSTLPVGKVLFLVLVKEQTIVNATVDIDINESRLQSTTLVMYPLSDGFFGHFELDVPPPLSVIEIRVTINGESKLFIFNSAYITTLVSSVGESVEDVKDFRSWFPVWVDKNKSSKIRHFLPRLTELDPDELDRVIAGTVRDIGSKPVKGLISTLPLQTTHEAIVTCIDDLLRATFSFKRQLENNPVVDPKKFESLTDLMNETNKQVFGYSVELFYNQASKWILQPNPGYVLTNDRTVTVQNTESDISLPVDVDFGVVLDSIQFEVLNHPLSNLLKNFVRNYDYLVLPVDVTFGTKTIRVLNKKLLQYTPPFTYTIKYKTFYGGNLVPVDNRPHFVLTEHGIPLPEGVLSIGRIISKHQALRTLLIGLLNLVRRFETVVKFTEEIKVEDNHTITFTKLPVSALVPILLDDVGGFRLGYVKITSTDGNTTFVFSRDFILDFKDGNIIWKIQEGDTQIFPDPTDPTVRVPGINQPLKVEVDYLFEIPVETVVSLMKPVHYRTVIVHFVHDIDGNLTEVFRRVAVFDVSRFDEAIVFA